MGGASGVTGVGKMMGEGGGLGRKEEQVLGVGLR